MTAPLVTLNMTIAQIEDELTSGKSVQQIAREWSEPVSNVLAVRQAMQGENTRPDLTVARQQPATSQTTGRTGSASPRPVPAPPAPVTPVAGAAEPTISALFNAAQRSSSARTRNLGKRLGAVADELLGRLKDERETAEAKAREAEVREKAAAEVARLEAAPAEARAKLGKGRGGSGAVSSRHSASGRAVAAKYAGRKPCEKCGKDVTSLPGPRGAHMKRCPGGAK